MDGTIRRKSQPQHITASTPSTASSEPDKLFITRNQSKTQTPITIHDEDDATAFDSADQSEEVFGEKSDVDMFEHYEWIVRSEADVW